jgi:hypothetical protein
VTRSRFTSTFRSRHLAALLVALAIAGAATDAWAQACCVAAGLTTPARLRRDERFSVGVGTRMRTVLGAFGPDGSYVGSADGNRELGAEEDLLGAVRVATRVQLALQIPFVQTARRVASAGGTALSEMGGGLGDVAASARWDLLFADERGLGWPGIALLGSVAAPTGRPADEATDTLAASATGTGSWRGELGVAVETVIERTFLTATLSVAQRSGRAIGAAPTVVHQAFAPQLTAAVVGGYALNGGSTVGVFVSATRQGNAREDGATIPRSGLGLFTAGVAAAVPVSDGWRLQGAAAGDLPIDGLGRNETAGVSLSAALVRAFL